MDYKKLAPVFSGLGVITMFVWGVLGNDWGHSWIAAVIGGVLSGICVTLSKQDDKKE